jgi:hypothetical protein
MTRLRPFYASQRQTDRAPSLETGYECNRDFSPPAERHWTQKTWVPARIFWRKRAQTAELPALRRHRLASIQAQRTIANNTTPATSKIFTSDCHFSTNTFRMPSLSKNAPRLGYRDACCRSTIIAIARR